MRRALTVIGLPLILAFSLAVTTAQARDEATRSAFIRAYEAASTGDLAAVGQELDTLDGYALYPYVQAAYFRWGLAQTDGASDRSLEDTAAPVTLAQVAEFLRAHPDLALDVLREDLLLAAADRRAYDLILALGSADAAHPTIYCAHLAARLDRALPEPDPMLEVDALAAWDVGRDRPAACDPVFAWLDARGLLTADLYRSRMSEAEEAGQYGLARYLAEQGRDLLEPWEVRRASLLELAYREPENALEAVEGSEPRSGCRSDIPVANRGQKPAPTEGETNLSGCSAAEVATLALERLARMDPERTAERFHAIADRFGLSEAQRESAWREVALWAARSHHPRAREWLATAADAGDTWLLQWRVRAALRERDWNAVLDAIEGLPSDLASEPVWTYWRGRALDETGRGEDAAAAYHRIAHRSDYYGFLAADRLGVAYALEVERGTPDPALASVVAGDPGLQRARELFHVADAGAPVWHLARAEWDRAIEALEAEGPPGAKAQAAMLAADWGWHSRALAAAWTAGLAHDYELRYPRPWHEAVHALSEQHGVDEAWVYGIIRSESLFMPDARSSAGAHGLMQLMPRTARDLLGERAVVWEDEAMLHRPDLNLSLGTDYLARMTERFQTHPVLASAAYNAGPHRVEAWLPEDGPLPADVWAETVPFLETRKYIRRVFTAATIFQSRMAADGHGGEHGEPVRLSARLAAVHPDGAAPADDETMPGAVKAGS